MSYGGQSNAPWQRNVMQGHPQSGNFHQGSQMFMQNNMAAYGMQDASGNSFPGNGGGNAVSYPQTRGNLNPVAFQQQGTGGPAQYNSIGTVTKISLDCGLVNDEVFFYRNVCKGPEPKLGDRVIFEATYSSNGQFKWNATRVQLMQQAQPLMGSNKGGYNSVPPPSDYQRQIRRNSPKRSPVRGRHERDNRERERLHRSRDRDEDEHERKRRREDRSRDRVAPAGRGATHAAAARIEKERDRGDTRKKERDLADREREREREKPRDLDLYRAGPKGRRSRVKRYMVEIPKSLLTIKTADVQDLHLRYSSLYIPSDFFFTNIKWSDTFTPDKPFSLRRPCQFHVMHEMVENPTEQNSDLLEPADSNYLYSAKVMLMALPPITEVYKKCFGNNDDDTDKHAVHPTRLINFLVGVKGRVGSMAIGGPWSPSLDGENPDKDPAVLIRTAIRTCKALTGIDLSNCTQWYRFVELFYHRTEYKNMGKDGPPRVETVVIYLPDVHSCMPSIEEWQTTTQMYKNAADEIIARRKALAAAAVTNENDIVKSQDDVEMADDNSTVKEEAAVAEEDAQNTSTDNAANTDAAADGDGDGNGENNDETNEVVAIDDDDEVVENLDDSAASANVSNNTSAVTNNGVEEDGAETEECANDEEAAEDENDEPAPEPTHYSLLELKAMKVQEIRDELLARGLPDKGVRNVVMARLAKALNTEKAEEMKNKAKKKPSTVQKSPVGKKTQEKKNDEKMDVDSETNKATDKKSTTDKKSHDKKETTTKSANNKKSSKGKKDKDEDWADVIDFELSDIVILDEYDSSKCNEETQLKEMTEKEKSQLIRHYTLPTAPHIIVHPNRKAKDGKFDCAVVSLSVLLDYHPDDSKERFFEVSLFAEIFNDMLARDFGFNIYKEIYLHKEPETEITEVKNESDVKVEKTEAGEENKKESKEKDDDKEKSSKKDSKSSNGEKSGKEQKSSDDTHSIKSESRKRKLSTSTANDKEHDSPANDKKMVVVKPQLLLSFLYFDTNGCGYIIDKHLENLFYVLGLNLSRSQTRNVLSKLGKLTTPHPVHYRKLTDKEATSDSTLPVIEDADDIQIEELDSLAAGNNIYESVFGKNKIQNQVSTIEGEGKSGEGLVNFNGTIVHVGKLLNQINRTEKNYSDLEKLYTDLLKQHGDLQKDHNKSTTKVKDLQTEVKSVSRKLTDANQDYYSLNRKYRDQNATLSYIYTRVEPYFSREKDVKAEKDKDNKEKEKEKPKTKENEKEKEKPKDEKDKDVKKEKTKEPEKEAEKVEEEKLEKPKEEKEKEKEKENVTEEMDVDKPKEEKPKEEKEKEKPKEEKEKEKPKDEKVKPSEKLTKTVTIKEKSTVKAIDNKEKEKVKEPPAKIETNNKPKDNIKPKPSVTANQVKSTPQKSVATGKVATPAAKKLNDNKTPAKIIKKSSDNVAAKK